MSEICNEPAATATCAMSAAPVASDRCIRLDADPKHWCSPERSLLGGPIHCFWRHFYGSAYNAENRLGLDASGVARHERTLNSGVPSTRATSPSPAMRITLASIAPYEHAVAAIPLATVATGALWPSNHNALFAFCYLAALLAATYVVRARPAVVLSAPSANYFCLAPDTVLPATLGALYVCRLVAVISAVLILMVAR